MDIWAFGVSPSGLGLPEAELYALTPREFQALREQWESGRLHGLHMYAALQSTLHNAHFPCSCSACERKAEANRQKHHEPFTPAMFLPGYQAQVQSVFGKQTVEEKMFMARALLSRAVKRKSDG